MSDFDTRNASLSPAPAPAAENSLSGAGINTGMSPAALKYNIDQLAAGLNTCTPEALAQARIALNKIRDGAFADPRAANQICNRCSNEASRAEPRVAQLGGWRVS